MRSTMGISTTDVLISISQTHQKMGNTAEAERVLDQIT